MHTHKHTQNYEDLKSVDYVFSQVSIKRNALLSAWTPSKVGQLTLQRYSEIVAGPCGDAQLFTVETVEIVLTVIDIMK